jgi:hypothetical protein
MEKKKLTPAERHARLDRILSYFVADEYSELDLIEALDAQMQHEIDIRKIERAAITIHIATMEHEIIDIATREHEIAAARGAKDN